MVLAGHGGNTAPGGVAVLEHHVQAAALVSQAVAGGAEIQQLDGAVIGDIDIIRSHIPVNDPSGMDRGQSLDNRFQNMFGFLPRETATLLQIVLQAGALDVVHDEVGRVILLEIAVHTHNVGISDKLRQCLSFV